MSNKLDKQYADEDRWIAAFVCGNMTRQRLTANLSEYHSGKALSNHVQMAVVEKAV